MEAGAIDGGGGARFAGLRHGWLLRASGWRWCGEDIAKRRPKFEGTSRWARVKHDLEEKSIFAILTHE